MATYSIGGEISRVDVSASGSVLEVFRQPAAIRSLTGLGRRRLLADIVHRFGADEALLVTDHLGALPEQWLVEITDLRIGRDEIAREIIPIFSALVDGASCNTAGPEVAICSNGQIDILITDVGVLDGEPAATVHLRDMSCYGAVIGALHRLSKGDVPATLKLLEGDSLTTERIALRSKPCIHSQLLEREPRTGDLDYCRRAHLLSHYTGDISRFFTKGSALIDF